LERPLQQGDGNGKRNEGKSEFRDSD